MMTVPYLAAKARVTSNRLVKMESPLGAMPGCGTAPVGTYWVFWAANCCCGLYVPGADGAEVGGM